MKYREIIHILEENGFTQKKQRGTSHHQYIGTVNGETKLVTVAYRNAGDDIMANNLASMRRQSGLPRELFSDRPPKKKKEEEAVKQTPLADTPGSGDGD